MKKKVISLITLLAVSSLLFSCNIGKRGSNSSQTPEDSGASNNGGQTPASDSTNHYDADDAGDSPDNTSDTNNNENTSADSNPSSDGSVDITPAPEGTFDAAAQQLLDGLNIVVPSANEYNLSFETIYYYGYDVFMLAAEGDDKNNEFETAYAAKFANNTTLVSLNDEDATVEEYGYLYADANHEVEINFFSYLGSFSIYITRTDGEHGTLDITEVDMSWYVDYINFQGFKLTNTFSSTEILSSLGITANIVIPDLNVSEYLTAFDDESGPSTYYVVVEGDKISAYVDILKLAGYTAELEEKTGETLDWDTFEVVEYQYYVGTAYDADQNIFINIELDGYDNTCITFKNYDDVYSSNTDWTDDDKALMLSTLHQILPFMQFGADYVFYDDSDEEYDVLVLYDTSAVDVSEDYAELLLENGFKQSSYNGEPMYVFDNGVTYIEIFSYYDDGNVLEIYFEPSKLPTLTLLSLNKTSLNIVAGGTYQLEPVYNPSGATYLVNWSSSDESIATVDNKGLVTINSNAQINDTVTITAATLNNKTATCTFTVIDGAVSGIEFSKDSYSVVPGGDKVQTVYNLLPYGATTTETISYSVNPTNVGIKIDDDGKVYAEATAVPGATATITVTCGSLSDTATVTVAQASITHTLTNTFFGITSGDTNYKTYTKATSDGASYEAQAASSYNSIQIRSKNGNSGIIGHYAGRSCKSITVTYESHTYGQRDLYIYASNSPFEITDMYNGSVTQVGTIEYNSNSSQSDTVTYTFTSNYSYIGIRSADGACYLTSIDIVW